MTVKGTDPRKLAAYLMKMQNKCLNEKIASALLADRKGRTVALKKVKAQVVLRDLMAEFEIEQSYENHLPTNIEALYTFPLPLGAVLLGFEVEIAGQKLSGQVVERLKAEIAYDEAIMDGDSAIMLEESGPGLYTVSLGNIMAGEKAVVRYRYALLLSWQGQRLRLMLPTTIAPRYGNPLAAGLEPHQIPESSLEVEYPLDLEFVVLGSLAESEICSPSHAIAVARTDDGITIRPSGKAALDRDFIITMTRTSTQSFGIITDDKEGQVALASFRIPQEEYTKDRHLNLKIVIDCSGSMSGVSIDQAKKATQGMLSLLKPEDHFNITFFGSSHISLFPSMVPADSQHIAIANSKIEDLNANMGGTEMSAALEAAFNLPSISNSDKFLILITDGEIWENEQIIKRAKSSEHRIFTVGVGSAVNEAFLTDLAGKTGGACELVSPQEGMSDRVLNQFHRLQQPRIDKLEIAWPLETKWSTKLPEVVFAGDTVHVFAGYQEPIKGSAVLKIKSSNGSTTEICAELNKVDEPEVPRLAASTRIAYANTDEALSIALEYQLLSPQTNYLVVAKRNGETADKLPKIHHVPQMLAAGWSGGGVNVRKCMRTELIEGTENSKLYIQRAAMVSALTTQATGEICERCGRPIVYKQGRFGRFLACSGYPACRQVKGQPTGVKCPEKDCDGDLILKMSIRGKVFYSCSRYPKCSFALWDKPVNEPCPACGASFLVEKESKAAGRRLLCLNPECNYRRQLEEQSEEWKGRQISLAKIKKKLIEINDRDGVMTSEQFKKLIPQRADYRFVNEMLDYLSDNNIKLEFDSPTS